MELAASFIIPREFCSGHLMTSIEGALAFGLPDRATAHIRIARARILTLAERNVQLVPHMTLVFLGEQRRSDLSWCLTAVRDILPSALEVRCWRMGVFQSDSMIVNLHWRVAPVRLLRRIHALALQICRQRVRIPAHAFVGRRFVPHVSIADGIRWREPPRVVEPGFAFTLGRLRLLTSRRDC